MSTSFLFFIIYVGAYVILLALFSIIFVLCLFFLCWVIIIEFQLCFILTLMCFSSKLFLHHNFMFLISLLHSCIYVYKTCIFNTQQHICQMIILCVSEHWIYIYIIIHCLVNSWLFSSDPCFNILNKSSGGFPGFFFLKQTLKKKKKSFFKHHSFQVFDFFHPVIEDWFLSPHTCCLWI